MAKAIPLLEGLEQDRGGKSCAAAHFQRRTVWITGDLRRLMVSYAPKKVGNVPNPFDTLVRLQLFPHNVKLIDDLGFVW